MSDAVIIDAVRTPIGRAFKGSLTEVRADELAALPLRALAERNPEVDLDETVDVAMGAASSYGEQGHNVGRNAVILAGLDQRVPACTVNRFCASSLQAIRMAFHAIRAGEGEQFIAAGVESVTRTGQGVGMMEEAANPRLSGGPDSLCDMYIAMGFTAENVAKKYGIDRESQDAWAVLSQGRAAGSIESGHFTREIVPVELPDGSIFDADECPRPGTTTEILAGLDPAFVGDGSVTAGNACPLNDGAAAVLVTSQERAKKLGLEPRARILASTIAGIAPELMGIGPVPAIAKLLEVSGLKIGDISIVEINEAFASQVVASQRELGISDEQLNPYGGAIALGHPFGATGARIMTTLLNGLETIGGRYGIESMCIGGGMGQAMLVERLDR